MNLALKIQLCSPLIINEGSQSFLVWRAGLLEGVLIVGVVEVPPDADVGGGDLEPLQPRHRHAHVVQLRQDLAVLRK